MANKVEINALQGERALLKTIKVSAKVLTKGIPAAPLRGCTLKSKLPLKLMPTNLSKLPLKIREPEKNKASKFPIQGIERNEVERMRQEAELLCRRGHQAL
jgi:molecular chaperone DnaK (HSP70)